MLKPWTNIAIVVSALLGTSCVSYREQPLDPVSELAALQQTNLLEFIVRRASPGEASDSSNQSFNLADGLNEAEVVSVALTLNPELNSKRLEIDEAQSLLIQAGLWPNPELAVTWKPGMDGAPGQSVDGDLLFELLKPWERSARGDAAKARVAEVDAEIVASEWRVVREARLGLLTVRAQAQRLALLGQELSLRERALDLATRSRGAGEISDLEASAAELELAEVRRDQRRAETELETARRELNQTLGTPPGYAIPLAQEASPLSITVFDDIADDEVARRLLAGRFELKALEAAYARAEHELRLAVYRQYPSLKLGPAFSSEPEGTEYLGLGLALDLPIFNQNQGEIAAKESQRRRARASYSATLHRLRAEALDAVAQLRRARLEVEAEEREVLPLLQRNQELFEGAFRARELNVLDWVAAQQRGLRARQTYLESLVRYRAGVIELEAATGMRLEAPGRPAEPERSP